VGIDLEGLPDCQRFYREHDRLIRECPTLRQQQELSWAALQAFRTLSGRVLEDLQKQHGARSSEGQAHATPVGGTEEPADAIQQAMADLENINAHLFSIEALMESSRSSVSWPVNLPLIRSMPIGCASTACSIRPPTCPIAADDQQLARSLRRAIIPSSSAATT